MKLGFTGTRYGMTIEQISLFVRFLKENQIDEFYHGDCIGADEEAHDLVAEYTNAKIFVLPCKIENLRAFKNQPEDRVSVDGKLRHPLDRNKLIVKHCDMLVGISPTEEEIFQGGTWYTINKAREKGKPVVVFTPKGKVLRI